MLPEHSSGAGRGGDAVMTASCRAKAPAAKTSEATPAEDDDDEADGKELEMDKAATLADEKFEGNAEGAVEKGAAFAAGVDADG
jgi:hypothetical protein